MKKILQFLKIIQIRKRWHVSGFVKDYRINPYNPFSYIAIPILFIVALLMFGIVGIRDEVDFTNPFKWQ